MSSSDESAESSDEIIADYDLKYVNRLYETRLKSLTKKVNYENEKERIEFLRHLYPLISDWKEQLPNLRDHFQPEEIESLLTDSLKHICNKSRHKKGRFVDFVVRTGYIDDQPKVDEDGKPLLRRSTPVHYAAKLVGDVRGVVGVVENLFKIFNKYDANYIDESGLSHFHVACQYGRFHVVEQFLELGQDPNCIRTETGDTPLHLALGKGCKEVAELLLRQGADPTLLNRKGVSILHYICKLFGDRDDFLNTLFETCRQRHQSLPINAMDESGNTALNLALYYKKRQMVQLLLEKGANPNLANEKGHTALHLVCNSDALFIDNIASMLFELSDKNHQPLQINAVDKIRNTPLHIALKQDNKEVAELLMRRGADLSVANANGTTPLHIICKRQRKDDLLKFFFEIVDKKGREVLIDAQDKKGNTPLHYAVFSGIKETVESLLKRDANPNLANNKGSTPLHFICYCDHDVDLVKMFFLVNDDKAQPVELDLVDELGLTPLQSAVASLLPDVVDVLLERVVDLSKFVFPNQSQFEERMKHWSKDRILYTFKLRQVSRLLLIVERLESSKKGFKLNRDSALMIMQLLDQNRFDKSVASVESWYDSKEFAREAEEILIRDNDPNLSLYDLTRLSPEEAAKLVTYSDYFEFAHSRKLIKLSEGFINPCVAHLCEKISKIFFWRWTIEFCHPAINWVL
uniref:Uncharacterized protein n=1 Tax=Trichogramma kaykai TaxID=54128 RepID=A0ABD2XG05_9HYME